MPKLLGYVPVPKEDEDCPCPVDLLAVPEKEVKVLNPDPALPHPLCCMSAEPFCHGGPSFSFFCFHDKRALPSSVVIGQRD